MKLVNTSARNEIGHQFSNDGVIALLKENCLIQFQMKKMINVFFLNDE